MNAEVLKVSGSGYYQCGMEIGKAIPDVLTELVDSARNNPPKGLTWEDCRNIVRANYFDQTYQAFHHVFEALVGVTDGAMLEGAHFDYVDLFATNVDELWPYEAGAGHCTDIVVVPPASTGVLAAHNNDLAPNYGSLLRAVEWTLPDKRVLSIGLGGLFTSVGMNSNGIGLVGNDLRSTDIRQSGVPREFIAQAIVFTSSYEEALAAATHPDRASSLNNIILTKERAVSVEGSATEHALLYPNEQGMLTHANHYCDPHMWDAYEPADRYVGSMARLARIGDLSRGNTELITADTLKQYMRDHGETGEKSDSTICRHGRQQTLFGVIFDMGEGAIELAPGNPCETAYIPLWNMA